MRHITLTIAHKNLILSKQEFCHVSFLQHTVALWCAVFKILSKKKSLKTNFISLVSMINCKHVHFYGGVLYSLDPSNAYLRWAKDPPTPPRIDACACPWETSGNLFSYCLVRISLINLFEKYFCSTWNSFLLFKSWIFFMFYVRTFTWKLPIFVELLKL